MENKLNFNDLKKNDGLFDVKLKEENQCDFPLSKTN